MLEGVCDEKTWKRAINNSGFGKPKEGCPDLEVEKLHMRPLVDVPFSFKHPVCSIIINTQIREINSNIYNLKSKYLEKDVNLMSEVYYGKTDISHISYCSDIAFDYMHKFNSDVAKIEVSKEKLRVYILSKLGEDWLPKEA